MFSLGNIRPAINFGRGQGFCREYADNGDHALERCADEKKNLRGGEWKAENAEDFLAHDACENRAEHHAEEGGEVGDDGVEGKVIRSVLIGQIDIGQRGRDGSRRNAEDMLEEADGNVEPDSVCRDEGVSVIGCRVENQNNGKRAEPIMSGDQLFPHIREEDEKKEIRGVDAVAERIADANVLKDIGVEGCVGEVERECIGGGNQDRAEKTLILEGERKNIGKFCVRFFCVRKFLRNQPDQAVNHGKRKCDESDGNEHCGFLRRSLERVTDGGNDKRDGKCDGTVDAACGIEIVYADIIRQEICVPRGKAGGEELVDGVGNDD